MMRQLRVTGYHLREIFAAGRFLARTASTQFACPRVLHDRGPLLHLGRDEGFERLRGRALNVETLREEVRDVGGLHRFVHFGAELFDHFGRRGRRGEQALLLCLSAARARAVTAGGGVRQTAAPTRGTRRRMKSVHTNLPVHGSKRTL